ARQVPFLQSLAWAGVIALTAALLALQWPRLRGRDWPTVRAELGLHQGRGVGSEMLAGLATYAVCLPLVVGAAFAISAWMGWFRRWTGGGRPADPFAPAIRPSHPIAGVLLHGDFWALLAVYWAAAVVAPFAEELAFRGFLQRHLRGFLGRLATAFAVAFIFAI